MDRVATEGRQGLVRTVPDGFESGSDVATMCLLGYDPKVYHTGRAPLEAAAQQHPALADRLGLPLQPRHRRRRRHEGPLGRRDHRRRGAAAASATSRATLDLPGFEFYTGVSYRNLLVYRGDEEFDVTTKPPHEIPEEPIGEVPAAGARAARCSARIMDRSRELFANHEINEVRQRDRAQPRDAGLALGPGPRAEHADVRGALRRRQRLR